MFAEELIVSACPLGNLCNKNYRNLNSVQRCARDTDRVEWHAEVNRHDRVSLLCEPILIRESVELGSNRISEFEIPLINAYISIYRLSVSAIFLQSGLNYGKAIRVRFVLENET